MSKTRAARIPSSPISRPLPFVFCPLLSVIYLLSPDPYLLSSDLCHLIFCHLPPIPVKRDFKPLLQGKIVFKIENRLS